jgi:probable O-glycosylation ligase (exosortase A-associated)
MKGLLFTYLLTYGGAGVALFNPFVGLLVYVCFAIIKPESLWYWSVPPGNYSRIVAIGLLLGWINKGFGNWKLGRARGIVGALLAFWLLTVVSALCGINPDRSQIFVEELTKIVLPFLVGITIIDSMKKVMQLAWVIVLSEGYLALEFNEFYYDGFNRLTEAGFGGMDNNCNAIALVTCAGMAFFLGLHSKEWWRKTLAFGAALLMVHAILFSMSRGGMLALLVTLLVSFLLIPKKPIHFLIFFLAVAVIWRLAGAEVTARFESTFADAADRDASAAGRLELWEGCWQTMLENPLGVGPDCFPLITPRFGFRIGKEAHTLWLQTGAEWGFPGLFCLLLFYFLCLRRVWPLAREKSNVADPRFRSLARGVIASLIGFMVSAQFVSLKGLEHPFYIVLIGATALKLMPMSVHEEQEDQPEQAEDAKSPAAACIWDSGY